MQVANTQPGLSLYEQTFNDVADVVEPDILDISVEVGAVIVDAILLSSFVSHPAAYGTTATYRSFQLKRCLTDRFGN